MKNEDNARVTPSAVEIEEQLLGSFIINNSYASVAQIIDSDCYFYLDRNKAIFNTIKELFTEGNILDIFIIIERLKKHGTLDLAGGVYTLSQISTKTIYRNTDLELAYILVEKFIRRECISLGHQIVFKSYDDTKDIFDIYEDSQKKIDELGLIIRPDQTVKTVKNITEGLFADIETDNPSIWPIGWPRFDNVITLCPNKILLISGPAKCGKTKFISSTMFHLFEQYEDVSALWVILEDSAQDILVHYLSSKILIKGKNLKQKNFNKNIIPSIKDFINHFQQFDIEFMEQSVRIEAIEKVFRNFCRKRPNRLNVLIIDNILSLTDREDFKGQDNAMYDYVMSVILRIRQKTGGLIIPLHHYKDAQQEKGNIKLGYRPRLTDLKGTEAFRRVPNQVLMLNKPYLYADLITEYPDDKDILEYIFICDTGANRDDRSDDATALIYFLHTLDYNLFEEL